MESITFIDLARCSRSPRASPRSPLSLARATPGRAPWGSNLGVEPFFPSSHPNPVYYLTPPPVLPRIPGPIDDIDCPHAMGTNAFSRIMIPRLPLRLRSGLRQRRDFGSGLRRPPGASTLCCYHRPIRLLRCAQSLRAGCGCLPRTQADESSSQPWSACGAASGFTFTPRKRERAAGRLCPAVELPHSSQNRA
jgi:hypothetical protein